MTITTAFLTVHVGEDPNIDITVKDDDGAVVDISSATEITWKLSVSETSTVLVSKSKTGSTITFTGGGTDGVFRVATLTTDFVLTRGTYYQKYVVTMPNNTVAVAVGTVWIR